MAVAAGTLNPPQLNTGLNTLPGSMLPFGSNRITKDDADYTRLHAQVARALTRSVARLVRELRATPQHEGAIVSAFIHRHTQLLRNAYAAAHAEGARDYWAEVSLRRAPKAALAADPRQADAALHFYTPSVAKMAFEAKTTAARVALADQLDDWQQSVAPRITLQARVVWSGLQDGYVAGRAEDPAAPFAQLYWELGPVKTEHCDDCPMLAAGSPYDAPGEGPNVLRQSPGDGETMCGANCHCTLRYGPAAAASATAAAGATQPTDGVDVAQSVYPAPQATGNGRYTWDEVRLLGAQSPRLSDAQRGALDTFRSAWNRWRTISGGWPEMPDMFALRDEALASDFVEQWTGLLDRMTDEQRRVFLQAAAAAQDWNSATAEANAALVQDILDTLDAQAQRHSDVAKEAIVLHGYDPYRDPKGRFAPGPHAPRPAVKEREAQPVGAQRESADGAGGGASGAREDGPHVHYVSESMHDMHEHLAASMTTEQRGAQDRAVRELERPARETVRNIFGRDLTDQEVASLVGARAGDHVYVEPLGHHEIHLEVAGANGSYNASRTLRKFENGTITLRNDIIHVVKQGQGLGAEILARQVAGASRLGVSRIDTTAARNGSMNGYDTWAKLGYDGAIPRSVRVDFGDQLAPLAPHGTIHELMRVTEPVIRLPNGRMVNGHELWKLRGDTWNGTFDLTPGSKHRQALRAYLSAKGRGSLADELQLREPQRMTSTPSTSERGEEIPWTDDDDAAAERAWRELNRRWTQEEAQEEAAEQQLRDVGDDEAIRLYSADQPRDHGKWVFWHGRQQHTNEAAHQRAQGRLADAYASGDAGRIHGAEVAADKVAGGIGVHLHFRDEDAQRAVEHVLGAHATRESVAKLVGAHPGDEVRIARDGSPEMGRLASDAVRIERYSDRGHGAMSLARLNLVGRLIPGLRSGGLVASGVSVANKERHGADAGAELVRSIRHLQQVGVKRIYAQALRSPTHNGYDTWAKLGAEGDIRSRDYNRGRYEPPGVSEALQRAQARFGRHVTRVEQVIDQPGGPAWWRQHGATFDARMDLTPGGRTARILDRLDAALSKRAARNGQRTTLADVLLEQLLADDTAMAMVLREAAADEAMRLYNPEEPRDFHGRWEGEGGEGRAPGNRAEELHWGPAHSQGAPKGTKGYREFDGPKLGPAQRAAQEQALAGERTAREKIAAAVTKVDTWLRAHPESHPRYQEAVDMRVRYMQAHDQLSERIPARERLLGLPASPARELPEAPWGREEDAATTARRARQEQRQQRAAAQVAKQAEKAQAAADRATQAAKVVRAQRARAGQPHPGGRPREDAPRPADVAWRQANEAREQAQREQNAEHQRSFRTRHPDKSVANSATYRARHAEELAAQRNDPAVREAARLRTAAWRARKRVAAARQNGESETEQQMRDVLRHAIELLEARRSA